MKPPRLVLAIVGAIALSVAVGFIAVQTSVSEARDSDRAPSTRAMSLPSGPVIIVGNSSLGLRVADDVRGAAAEPGDVWLWANGPLDKEVPEHAALLVDGAWLAGLDEESRTRARETLAGLSLRTASVAFFGEGAQREVEILLGRELPREETSGAMTALCALARGGHASPFCASGSPADADAVRAAVADHFEWVASR